MNQTQKIRKHLESGQSINPLQALKLFGCFRLGARIYELRQAGMKITRSLSKQKHFAIYSL